MSKVWLITGAANGIGRSTAELVLERGDRLVATARRVERLSELEARYGDRVVLHELDVTDPHAAKAAVTAAIGSFGRLDVLLNNAGFAHLAPFEQTSEADFRAEIDTNFYGVVNLVRAALPIMRQQRAGHILNISSSSGRFGGPGSSAYSAAKWAVSGFTESLAKEIRGFGVKAVSIEPGSIRTNWTRVARGHVPQLLAEYEPTIGVIMELTRDLAGNEPGDPAKLAQVLFELSRRDEVPEHLVLGSDAVARVAKAEADRAQAAEAWLATSLSTDF